MDIYIDLNTKLVEFNSIGSGIVGGEKVKIRQTEDIRVKWHRGGSVEEITGTDAIFVGLKQAREGAVLAQQTSWSHTSGTANFYTAALDLNTQEITTDLFDAEGETRDEIAVLLEITRTPSGGAVRRYDDASLMLVRSVFTGDEGAPSAADAAASLVWLAANGIARIAAITGLTGGGQTNLDGYTGVSALGSYIALDISNELQDWELVSSTAPTDAANGIVRHASYAATTFERVWNRRR